MLLLVSVRNASEAAAALAGGADVIDAKDPEAGALGAVSLSTLRGIRTQVGDVRIVSAAIGDAADEALIECQARDYARAGAAFVKVGFYGVPSVLRVESLLRAALRGSREVIAVGYADATSGISPNGLIDIAARTGARGVLLDTADKRAPRIRELMDDAALAAWVDRAHACGLMAAAAGSLRVEDLPFVHAAGADIAGVRGAACEGGRNGAISEAKVRLLRSSLRTPTADRRRQTADCI